MENFFPKTGSELEWNTAYGRLEEYLRALHMVSRIHQNQIILSVLKRAANKHIANPGLCPMVLAMEELYAVMERWFDNVGFTQERASVTGLTSLLATDAFERWPGAFLGDNYSTSLKDGIWKGRIQTSPKLQISCMVPQPFTNPLTGANNFNFSQLWGRLMQYLASFDVKDAASFPSVFPKTPKDSA